MLKKLICALGAFWLAGPLLLAQTAPLSDQTSPTPVTPSSQTQDEPPANTTARPALTEEEEENAPPPPASALDADLFYQLLMGEFTAQEGQAETGVALYLDAARKTNDAQLYQRATDMALQSRLGDTALRSVRAWHQAHPNSRDANLYWLQILVALNRIEESAEPLKAELEMMSTAENRGAMVGISQLYANAGDKKLALAVVQDALAPYLNAPTVASAAWTTLARMQLLAGDATAALEAAQRGQSANLRDEGPALVALEMLDLKYLPAERLVTNYLNHQKRALPEIRMAYVQRLIRAMRYPEAMAHLHIAVRDQPDMARAWLALGSLQWMKAQAENAETSFTRYIALAEPQAEQEETRRGLTQAYLGLSRIAEKRRDFATAETLLDKIESPESMVKVQVQIRRASLLAAQNKLPEARQLIRELPERKPEDARLKLLAEFEMLRTHKQYPLAYAVLAEASALFPDDAELVYDQAMMAEKIGQLPDMERLLKRAIALKPDYQHAYNALGYSLADRNVRLLEARELIRKALVYAPADPLIQDSLGWVEFRLGNRAEAIRILKAAFMAQPDAEIAAHFGEAVWHSGQHERAMAIWREGLRIDPQNQTLKETIKRLQKKKSPPRPAVKP